jgi:hypothetical protein
LDIRVVLIIANECNCLSDRVAAMSRRAVSLRPRATPGHRLDHAVQRRAARDEKYGGLALTGSTSNRASFPMFRIEVLAVSRNSVTP